MTSAQPPPEETLAITANRAVGEHRARPAGRVRRPEADGGALDEKITHHERALGNNDPRRTV